MEKEAENDLVLLERVFLRFAVVETDDDFQAAVTKFLIPVVQKISSPHEDVRKKVMELLVHITKRLKSRPCIQLPMEMLLKIFADPEASSFTMNFSIVYIKMGFLRLPSVDQSNMFSLLLKCIPDKPPAHQQSFLHLLIRSLPQISFPQLEFAKFVENEKKAAKLVFDVLLTSFLLPPSNLESLSTTVTAPAGICHPHLAYFVNNENPITSEEIQKIKIGAVKLLSMDELSYLYSAPLLYVASADSYYSIASSADFQLRKMHGEIDVENAQFVATLFKLINGTQTTARDSAKPESARNPLKHSPVSVRVRQKLIPVLTKSTKAVSTYPAVIQLTYSSFFGDTTPKLKHLTLHFVRAAVNIDKLATPCAALIKSALVKLLSSEETDIQSQNLALVCLGLLGSKQPSLFVSDISLLEDLFNRLSSSSSDHRMSVMECLNMLAAVYRELSPKNQEVLFTILESLVKNEDLMCRRLAVKYLNIVYHITDIPTRYLLLILSGDNSTELASEALSALSPTPDQDWHYPMFPDMFAYVNKQKANQKASKSVDTPSSQFSSQLDVNISLFLRACILQNNSAFPPKDMTKDSFLLRQKIPSLCASDVTEFIQFLLSSVKHTHSYQIMFMLLELAIIANEPSLKILTEELAWIKANACGYDTKMRPIAAELYALLLRNEKDTLHSHVNELLSAVKSDKIEVSFGSSLILAYLHTQNPMVSIDSLWSTVFETIINLLNKEKSGWVSICSQSFTIACRVNNPLHFLNKEVFYSFLERLGKMLLSSNEQLSKCKTDLIACIGGVCLSEFNKDVSQRCIELLFKTNSLKQVDIHFAVGSALLDAALGPKSPRSKHWSESEKDLATDEDILRELLDKILSDYALSPVACTRQAGVIWLSSCIKQCAAHPSLQSMLRRIQGALMSLVGDRDSMIQDLSSKSLAMLYDASNPENKKLLVNELMETFAKGRRTSSEMIGETEVFHQGELGTSPSGGSLSTYKDLCSLANEMNKPDLVYKFLNLAHHNMMWSSKLGAGLGFGYIASRAGSELNEYLPHLIPKLYRYQFDPNTQVKNSMTAIWGSVVSDHKDTVDKYLLEISNELLSTLTNSEWRVRESSCLALADLLRGRSIHPITDLLPEFWLTLFRVRDDVKESVAAAADVALKSLSASTIKICQTQSKRGQEVMESVVPVLLDKGLQSNIKAVVAVSLSCLISLSKEAGRLLKPHAAEFITALLNSLSDLEPKEVSYLSVLSGDGSQKQSAVDSVRASAAKSSPMMDCLQLVVQQVDESNMAHVVSALLSIVQSAVGLGTKVGASHLITSLCIHCKHELQPFAGKILKCLMLRLNDRSPTIRKQYCSTISHVIRIGKPSVVEKNFERVKSWYIEKEDDELRLTCAYLFSSSCSTSLDVVKEHATLVAPLSYIGISEEDESTSEIWKEVWQEIVPGTEGGVKLYHSEIVGLAKDLLGSTAWKRKVQAARVLSHLAKDVSRCLTRPIFMMLVDAVSLGLSEPRYWTGKEMHLNALERIVSAGKDIIAQEDREFQQKLFKLAFSEYHREEKDFQLQSLLCMGTVMESCILDAEYTKIISLPISNLNAQTKVKSGDSITSSLIPVSMRHKLEVQACKCLAQAWPRTVLDEQVNSADQVMSLLQKVATQGNKAVQKIALESIESIVEKFMRTINSTLEDVALNCLAFLNESAEIYTKETLQLAYMSTISTLLSYLKEMHCKIPKEILTATNKIITSFASSTKVLTANKAQSVLSKHFY